MRLGQMNALTLAVLFSGKGTIAVPFGANFAAIGDSWVADGVATVGVQTLYPSYAVSTYIPVFCGGQIVTALNGIQGYTGAQTGVIKTHMAAVLAVSPKVLMIQGGINNLIANDTAANIFADLMSMARQANGANAIAVLQTVPKTFGGSALTGPQETQRLALNTLLLAAQTTNILVVDASSAVTVSGDLRDGVHPTYATAAAIGRLYKAALSSRLPNGDVLALLTSGTVLAGNQNLGGSAGTKTGVTGSVATSWDAQGGLGGGATAVSSKASGDVEQLALSGTYSGSTPFDYMQDFVTGVVGSGEVWEQIAKVEIISKDANLDYLSLNMTTLDSGYATKQQATMALGGLLASDGPVIVRGPRLTGGAGNVYLQNQVIMQLVTQGGSTAIADTIKVYNCGSHRVS